MFQFRNDIIHKYLYKYKQISYRYRYFPHRRVNKLYDHRSWQGRQKRSHPQWQCQWECPRFSSSAWGAAPLPPPYIHYIDLHQLISFAACARGQASLHTCYKTNFRSSSRAGTVVILIEIRSSSSICHPQWFGGIILPLLYLVETSKGLLFDCIFSGR